MEEQVAGMDLSTKASKFGSLMSSAFLASLATASPSEEANPSCADSVRNDTTLAGQTSGAETERMAKKARKAGEKSKRDAKKEKSLQAPEAGNGVEKSGRRTRRTRDGRMPIPSSCMRWNIQRLSQYQHDEAQEGESEEDREHSESSTRSRPILTRPTE